MTAPKRPDTLFDSMSSETDIVSEEWRAWVAESLVRGAPRGRIEATLEEEGLSPAEAQSLVSQVEATPELIGARRALVRGRRLEKVAALRKHLEGDAEHPGRVPLLEPLPAEEFFDLLYAHAVPACMRGFAREWPAVRRWDFGFFRERFGSVEVTVTSGREHDPDYDMDEPGHRETVTLGELCSKIEGQPQSNAFYMVAQNRNLEREALRTLFDDIDFSFGYLSEARGPGCALWMGPGGTITPLHHDTCNILFVQVHGRKRVRLISPFEESLFERAKAMYALDEQGHHDLDAQRPDVLTKEVVLEPGDALFIPVGYWHHVVALTPSISLAFSNFKRPNCFGWYTPGSLR